jgi:hypothetical protein
MYKSFLLVKSGLSVYEVDNYIVTAHVHIHSFPLLRFPHQLVKVSTSLTALMTPKEPQNFGCSLDTLR